MKKNIQNNEITSPCISICRTDPRTGYCYGCARTNEEKIIWKDINTNSNWKRENLIRFNELSELTTKVIFNDLTDWINVRTRLRHVALLKAAQVISISRHRLIVRIVFYGDADQLCVALAQQDLSL